MINTVAAFIMTLGLAALIAWLTPNMVTFYLTAIEGFRTIAEYM